MNTLPVIFRGMILCGLAVSALCVYTGCGSKKESESSRGVQPLKHVTSQLKTVKVAKSLKVTFDNPKAGHCPVCNDPVNYQDFVSIRHKQYALCSEKCAERFEANPNLYLSRAQNP